jgi:hypothetical protein
LLLLAVVVVVLCGMGVMTEAVCAPFFPEGVVKLSMAERPSRPTPPLLVEDDDEATAGGVVLVARLAMGEGVTPGVRLPKPVVAMTLVLLLFFFFPPLLPPPPPPANFDNANRNPP